MSSDFPFLINVEDGISLGISLPFLLFFFMNFPISRCQFLKVTKGAITRVGEACFSVERYANV